MKTLIKNGKVITPFGIKDNTNILIESGKISQISCSEKALHTNDINIIDAKGKYISPGFIDIHNHGNFGHDTMEGNFEAIDSMAKFHIRNGVTGFLATTNTASISVTKKIASQVADYIEKYNPDYSYPKAQVLGVYFEGPYFSMKKKGAQPAGFIKNPIPEEAKELIQSARGYGKIFAISAGHSNATYDETILGIENGVTEVTHLYNGMRSFNHREPGIIGAALSDNRVSCEIICDGIHLHKAAVKIAVELKGKNRIILISDAMMAAGLKEGVYQFGNQKVSVKNGAVKLEDGTLAGSTLTLNKAVYNMVHLYGVSLEDSVYMASFNPAKAIGMADTKGSIEIGKDADIIIFDDYIDVSCAIVNGNVLYTH